MSDYIPREQLELIAGKYTDRYFLIMGRKPDGFLPPVDPTILAQQVLELNLHFLPLSVDGSILGLSVFDTVEFEVSYSDGDIENISLGEKDIVVDAGLLGDNYTGRRNFTIAHENAHHILNREFRRGRTNPYYRRFHISYRRRARHDPEEWRADTLASMMLMPVPLILDCMHRFGLDQGIDILNCVFRPAEYERFVQMASYLGVSKQALCIRLKQLKLIRKEYLANPYDMVNVYMDDE